MRYFHIFFVFVLAFCACFIACKEDKKAPIVMPQGQVDPAVEKYTIALAENPNSDSLYYRRAEAYYQLEGYDEAIQDLQRAISIDSMRPAYYHLLADAYFDYFKSYPAIETMQKAANRFPDNIPTLLKLSEFYLIVEKHGASLKVIDQILQRDPQNAEAFFMTGMVAKDMKDTTRAIKAFEKSVSLEPENYDAWIILGNLLLEKNSPVCIRYYDNAMRVDSSNAAAYDGKATYFHKNGRLKEAIDTYQKIVINQPQRAESYFDIGLIYLEIDSLNQAGEHFDLTVKNDPLFFKAIYYQGFIAEKQGDKATALQKYKQVVGMVPDFEEAIAALKRLEGK